MNEHEAKNFVHLVEMRVSTNVHDPNVLSILSKCDRPIQNRRVHQNTIFRARLQKISSKKLKQNDSEQKKELPRLKQGCQIFVDTTYQNGKNIPK
jgi:hypothetical protein